MNSSTESGTTTLGVICLVVLIVFFVSLFFPKMRLFYAITALTIFVVMAIIGSLLTPPVGWIFLAYMYSNNKTPKGQKEMDRQQQNTVMVDIASRI